jgi:MFS transporter, OFA family, oxalate/formate antiporter
VFAQNISSPQNGKQPRFFYGYIILLSAFIILWMVGGALASFGVFLKPVLEEFGWSRATISSAYSLNMVFGGLVGILAGRITDRFSPRLSLTIGGIFIGAGYMLMSQVHSVWQIYLFYGILISTGAGFTPIPLLSLVARWFEKGRGVSSGIIMAGVGLGMVIVPPLANHLISQYSWQTSYLILGAACFVLMIVFAQFLRRAPGHSRPNTDLTDSKADSPNIQTQGKSLREAMGTLRFWIIIAMGFFFFYGAQNVFVHIAAHATDIGYSSIVAATILSVIGFVNIGSTIGGGLLGDKIGTRNMMVIVFSLAALSFLGFRIFTDLWLLYLCAVIFGLAYGGFTGEQTPLIADYFGLKDLGAMIGFFLLAQNIGGGLGSVIAGSIFDNTGNYQWAFLICFIFALVALGLSITLKPARKKTH